MYNSTLKNIIKNSNSIFKGKTDRVALVLCNIIAGGHTLIEDTPGVGKTTLVKYISKVLGFELSRVQFTNDLLPSDILGSSIYDKESQKFKFHKGPIFGEVILADELNRAPAKTQSALLQAMEEGIINIDGQHYDLPEHFTVLATQNPNSQLGTFPLPESQLDRFSMKIDIGQTSKEATIDLLKEVNILTKIENLDSALSPDQILKIQKDVQSIHLDESIYELIYSLLEVSRVQSDFQSLSNRCGIDIVKCAKAHAYINQRDFVLPDDVFYMFPYVAGHRLSKKENATTKEEQKSAESLIQRL